MTLFGRAFVATRARHSSPLQEILVMSNNGEIAKTLELVRCAYNEVVEDVARQENAGAGGIEHRQLLYCKVALQRMMDQLESGQLPPEEERENGIGRMISDSWPFNSALGKLLLEAEQRYRGL